MEGLNQILLDSYLPSVKEQMNSSVMLDILRPDIKVSGPQLNSRQAEGVFLNALREEMEGIKTDLRRDLDREIYNEPGEWMNYSNTSNTLDPFGVLPRKNDYGHIVRIPVIDGRGGERVLDLTVKEARRTAKAYRKAARRIEKIVG